MTLSQIRKKRVLLTYASFGAGHKNAALALQKYFDCPCLDLLDFSFPFVKRIYAKGYLIVTQRFPWVWRFVFHLTRYPAVKKFIRRFDRIVFFKFLPYLRGYQPDVVIDTHFFPIAIVSQLKQEREVKVLSLVTDIRAHPLWVDENVDQYFLSFETTKQDLMRLGVKEDRIVDGVVPLREGFYADVSNRLIAHKLGFDQKPCLLFIVSRRTTLKAVERFIKRFSLKFNLLIVCGTHWKLFEYLQEKTFPGVRFFPFYDAMWELVSLCGVIIGKPGGLTVFEGIYKKKPFIFTHYIPGQEEGNMEFLMNHGLARLATDERQLIDSVEYFVTKAKAIAAYYPLTLGDVREALYDYLVEWIRQEDDQVYSRHYNSSYSV